jgi:hypothetical protein
VQNVVDVTKVTAATAVEAAVEAAAMNVTVNRTHQNQCFHFRRKFQNSHPATNHPTTTHPVASIKEDARIKTSAAEKLGEGLILPLRIINPIP